MKKLKGTIIFSVIFLIILIIYFILYKNIDILFPLPEKEIYSFENNSPKEEDDFLLGIYEQVEIQTNYKKINEEELNNILENDILFNIITDNIFEKNIDQEELKCFFQSSVYTGKLYNTIYGDLKIVREFYNQKIKENSENLIVYSEDMNKIYYMDINNYFAAISKITINEGYEVPSNLQDEIEQDLLEHDKKGKTEIINNCGEKFKKIINNYEFNSDIIINKGNYYILKDNTNDITVYYNSNENIIFGIYIGFGK